MMQQLPEMEVMQQQSLRQRLFARVYFLFAVTDIETAEIALTASVFWWAFVVGYYGPRTTNIPIYQGLFAVAPPAAWSAVWWISGVVALVGVLTGWVALRRMVMLWLVFTWAFAATVLFRGPRFSNWSGQVVIFALTALWVYLRLNFAHRVERAERADRLSQQEAQRGG